DVVPGGPARRVDAALRQTSAKLRVAEHAAHTGYDRLAVVRDDERLAVLEEARDPAAVRDDHGRSGCGRLGGDDAEALSLGCQHEHVCLRIEVVRWLIRRGQSVDAAGLLFCCTHEV